MTDKPSNFFEWPVRVYIPDTDSVGVVYHGEYLRFADMARTEWLRHINYPISRMKADFGLAPVVARVEVDYKKPAVVDELLIIRCSVASMTGVRSIMRQEITCEGDLRADLLVTLVWVTEAGRPAKLPSEFVRLFDTSN